MMKLVLLCWCWFCMSCMAFSQGELASSAVVNGDERMSEYLPFIRGKRVAVVANQTAVINGVHLVDTLIKCKINVVKVFAPEHGFRGIVPAGEKIDHGVDEKTGIQIVSLYGKHEAPDSIDLMDVDVVLFDIQDVGARFYTYLSTMKYVMESCNEFGKTMIILDRPNPNGHYVDGPILNMNFASMVGVIPIPVVHGCTLGELAFMIVGEGWLVGQADTQLLKVIPCMGYVHDGSYSLKVAPSPNLSSDCAIQCYPSLCFFEGTSVSVGRGTSDPFTCYGFPQMRHGAFLFTPVSIKGKVTHPPYENQLCQGVDLRGKCTERFTQIDLSYLLNVYQELGESMFISPSFFDKLAGSDQLRKDICSGKSEIEIRDGWREGLKQFNAKRKLYLLYP